jgi:PKD repeat protein
VADFSGSPTSGTAPLAVSFTDTSTNDPTGWAWDFDADGTTDSTAQHPSHTYDAAGTYTVRLTATNSAGSNTVTKTDYISVGASGGGGEGQTLTFTSTADSYVVQNKANNNYGSAKDLRIRSTSSQTHIGYVRFDVGGLGGSVTSATLRLYVTDPSYDGGSVYLVSNDWGESTITWNNAPAISTAPLGSTGDVVTGTWVEVDVSAALTGNGSVSFALRSDASNSALYSSREGTNPPQLVVMTGG